MRARVGSYRLGPRGSFPSWDDTVMSGQGPAAHLPARLASFLLSQPGLWLRASITASLLPPCPAWLKHHFSFSHWPRGPSTTCPGPVPGCSPKDGLHPLQVVQKCKDLWPHAVDISAQP